MTLVVHWVWAWRQTVSVTCCHCSAWAQLSPCCGQLCCGGGVSGLNVPTQYQLSPSIVLTLDYWSVVMLNVYAIKLHSIQWYHGWPWYVVIMIFFKLFKIIIKCIYTLKWIYTDIWKMNSRGWVWWSNSHLGPEIGET